MEGLLLQPGKLIEAFGWGCACCTFRGCAEEDVSNAIAAMEPCFMLCHRRRQEAQELMIMNKNWGLFFALVFVSISPLTNRSTAVP